jgi:hypothetical protein
VSPCAGCLLFAALDRKPLSGPLWSYLTSTGRNAYAHERPQRSPSPCSQPGSPCCHGSSVAALIVGSLHAGLPGRAFVYTLAILCLRLSALARLSRRHAVLIPLGLPRGAPVRVISASLLSVMQTVRPVAAVLHSAETLVEKTTHANSARILMVSSGCHGRQAVVMARPRFNSRSSTQLPAYPLHLIARIGINLFGFENLLAFLGALA